MLSATSHSPGGSKAPPKDRDDEIRKRIERSRRRFGKEPRRTPIEPIG